MQVVENSGLPFLVEGQVVLSTRAQRLELVIAASASSGTLENTGRLLQLWVVAGDFGMFTPAGTDVRLNHMHVRSMSGPEAGVINAQIETAGMDPSAYRVLLSMLAQSHYALEPLHRVSLRSEGAAPGQVIGPAGMAHLRGVPHCDAPPFALFIPQPLEENAQPVIRIQFSRRLAANEFAHVAQGLATWDDLIAAEGFAEGFEPVELMETSAECYMLSPDTLEHPCEGAPHQPVAYDALLNMAAKLDATVCPIRVLEID